MGAWAKFPTVWIQNDVLSEFQWRDVKGDGTAAFLVLIALAIKLNRDKMEKGVDKTSPVVSATYDQIQNLMAISRSKVAKGLALLLKHKIIERADGQSLYKLTGVDTRGGWAMMPQEYLMAHKRITTFEAFKLRSMSEFDALKLYFLMLSLRHNQSGFAHVGYTAMTERTGVPRERIKRAKSHLISLELIHAESYEELSSAEGRPSMRYKINGLYKNVGEGASG